MGNLKLRSMRGFPSSEPPQDQPCPSSPSCFWGAPVEPLDGGLDSLHPCSWQFPAAAPAMAQVHGTRSDLSWDWDRPTPGAGSSSALTQGRESWAGAGQGVPPGAGQGIQGLVGLNPTRTARVSPRNRNSHFAGSSSAHLEWRKEQLRALDLAL